MIMMALRIPAFLVAFAVGLAMSPAYKDKAEQVVNKVPAHLSATKVEGRVTVDFVGYGESRVNRTLDLRIVNHTRKPVTYSSYGEDYPSFFQLEVNGVRQNLFWCGTGAVERTLMPGESVEGSIPVGMLMARLPVGKSSVRVGYYLTTQETEKGILVWSAPIEITKRKDR